MKQSLKFNLNSKSSTHLHAPQTTLLQGVSRSAIRSGGPAGHPPWLLKLWEGKRGSCQTGMERRKTRTLETRKGAAPRALPAIRMSRMKGTTQAEFPKHIAERTS